MITTTHINWFFVGLNLAMFALTGSLISLAVAIFIGVLAIRSM